MQHVDRELWEVEELKTGSCARVEQLISPILLNLGYNL
jgi:hypothetical protein